MEYSELAETARNSHGTPGCDCALFTAPSEARTAAEVAAELIAAADAAEEMARRRAVVAARRVRMVNRRDPQRRNKYFRMPRLENACQQSSDGTLRGCPRGRKCWFKHTDEG